jgi:hypothetical protein
MTAKSKFSKPRPRKSDLPSNIEDRIRRRAFELYEQRGRVDGFALGDWLQAESEILRAQKQHKAKAARGSQC